jgi:hypothetical protein
MIKCGKAQIRQLKTALRWKIPAAQRQRIQMVLLRGAKVCKGIRSPETRARMSAAQR